MVYIIIKLYLYNNNLIIYIYINPRKNALLKLRSPITLIMELALPTLIIIAVGGIRSVLKPETVEKKIPVSNILYLKINNLILLLFYSLLLILLYLLHINIH